MKRFAYLFALAAAGCSSAHMHTTSTAYTAALPPPTQVIVTDFAITPDQVRLDSGVGARLIRTFGSEPPTAEQLEAAQETRVALSETLVAKLRAYGLPAQRVAAEAVPPPGSLLVQGQFVSVDEGNRTRRTLIGLGAGKSSVSADAQLYYIADPAQPRFLQAFEGSADSGRMPGAAETMGASVAADRVATSAVLTGATHTAGERRRAGYEAEADKLADALAHRIGDYAVSQGWLAASAVK